MNKVLLDITRLKFTPEELRECYIDKRMSQRAIAKHFHVDVRKIRHAMQVWNIPVRDPSWWLSDHKEREAYDAGLVRGSHPLLPQLKKGDPINYLHWHYIAYNRHASDRNREFGLSVDQFEEMVTQPCHYCGLPPSRKVGKVYFSGIDRIDSNLGYVVGNVRPCCGNCNMGKRILSEEEFITWVLRTADHIRANGLDNR